MKIIERPTSTSYVLDFPFHFIRDKFEANNVKNVIGDREIVHVARGMNPSSYMPMLYFAVRDDSKPFSEWLKYVTTMVLMIEVTGSELEEINE